MRPDGLAGTIAAAMQSAEMAKAAMAAKALLALKRDIFEFPFSLNPGPSGDARMIATAVPNLKNG